MITTELVAMRGKKYDSKKRSGAIAFYARSIVFLPEGVEPGQKVRVQLFEIRPDRAGRMMYRAEPAEPVSSEQWRFQNDKYELIRTSQDWKGAMCEEVVKTLPAGEPVVTDREVGDKLLSVGRREDGVVCEVYERHFAVCHLLPDGSRSESMCPISEYNRPIPPLPPGAKSYLRIASTGLKYVKRGDGVTETRDIVIVGEVEAEGGMVCVEELSLLIEEMFGEVLGRCSSVPGRISWYDYENWEEEYFSLEYTKREPGMIPVEDIPHEISAGYSAAQTWVEDHATRRSFPRGVFHVFNKDGGYAPGTIALPATPEVVAAFGTEPVGLRAYPAFGEIEAPQMRIEMSRTRLEAVAEELGNAELSALAASSVSWEAQKWAQSQPSILASWLSHDDGHRRRAYAAVEMHKHAKAVGIFGEMVAVARQISDNTRPERPESGDYLGMKSVPNKHYEEGGDNGPRSDSYPVYTWYETKAGRERVRVWEEVDYPKWVETNSRLNGQFEELKHQLLDCLEAEGSGPS